MKTIQLTEEQWAELQNGTPIVIAPPKTNPTKWEPEEGKFYISSDGLVREGRSTPAERNFGMGRKTEQEAEAARDAIRVHNRLLAYRDEFDPDYAPNWQTLKSDKYYVFFNHKANTYECSYAVFCETLGAVYMSKEVTVQLVGKLNSGEVVL